MSLSFDVTKIADHEVVTTSPADPNQWHPVTQTLVWALMFIGVGEITRSNLKVVKHRVAQYQAAVGPLLTVGWNDVYITDADIVSHVGLSTNVSGKTESQWAKSLMAALDRTADANRTKQEVSASDLCACFSIRRDDGSFYVTN